MGPRAPCIHSICGPRGSQSLMNSQHLRPHGSQSPMNSQHQWPHGSQSPTNSQHLRPHGSQGPMHSQHFAEPPDPRLCPEGTRPPESADPTFRWDPRRMRVSEALLSGGYASAAAVGDHPRTAVIAAKSRGGPPAARSAAAKKKPDENTNDTNRTQIGHE